MEELQTEYQILQERIKQINQISKEEWKMCSTHFTALSDYVVFRGEDEQDVIFKMIPKINSDGEPYVQVSSGHIHCPLSIEHTLLEKVLKGLNILHLSEEELIEIITSTTTALTWCLGDLLEVQDKREKLQSILDELNQN